MKPAPAGPHLLDTSAVIVMMRQHQAASSEALIPFATLGELLTGVERVGHPVKERANIRAAVGNAPVLHSTNRTAQIYARIAAALQRAGQPIPTNDLWNAALALEWDLNLLANDAHFARVPGLKFVSIR